MRIGRKGAAKSGDAAKTAKREMPCTVGFALILESMMALRETHAEYGHALYTSGKTGYNNPGSVSSSRTTPDLE
jgi:hypothetical protein